MAQNKLKMSSLHLFVHPKWSKINFGQNAFLPHLSLVPRRPILKAFWGFHWPKRVTMGSKPSKTFFSTIPSGRGTNLEKITFFGSGTPLHPPVGPNYAQPRLPSGSTK